MGSKNEREKTEKLKQTLEYVEDERNELLDALRWHYNANPGMSMSSLSEQCWALIHEPRSSLSPLQHRARRNVCTVRLG